MGLSSNQARFLSLTSRQVDMEQRIQQICQRRLRLSSELENVATSYNNQISNRKMYAASTVNQGIDSLSLSNLDKVGYKIIDNETNIIIGQSPLTKQVLSRATVNAGEIAITSAAQLKAALNADPTGHYVLMNDIDLSALGPLSDSVITNTFTGSFDGNGYKLSNMNITETSAKSTGTNVHLGLFSTLANGATISNLILENCQVNTTDTANPGDQNTSRNNTSGVLAGFMAASGGGAVIDNVTVLNSTVNSDHAAGGLVGIMQAGSITNSTTSGTVSGTEFTGGLVGQIQGGVIDICNSSSNVSGWSYVGGLVGESLTPSNPIISRSYATGDVSGNDQVGGLIGRNHNAILQDCYTTGDVSGSTNVGGICGDTMDTNKLINCYTTGDVSGSTNVGGLIGYSGGTATVQNSFWIGNATSAIGNGSASVTNAVKVADMTALTAAAKTAGWGSNPNEFASTPLTGSGGSWDTSTTPPKLYAPEGYSWTPDDIEANLRNGRFSLVKEADEYTQNPIAIGTKSYEKKDWRSVPQVYDELYESDNKDAEDKYDKIISEINAQDKKLQLEQTSIETEYKAVSSERESVKKILDTNAQSSFKYFS